MQERILIVGGDRRQQELTRLLALEHRVDTLGVPLWPDTARQQRYGLVILPCPAFDREGNIRCSGGGLPTEAAAPYLGPETLLLGGALGRGEAAFLTGAGRARDLLQDPFFAAENARLTAEAAVALTMKETGRSLRGQRCALLGFGRIGKALARHLHHLGAELTVAARRPEVLAEAESLGFSPGGFPEAAAGAEVIFNTVPAPVLSPQQAGGLGREQLWVELASAPGGLPTDTELLCRVVPAGGLPGRVLPLSAALALKQAIVRSWEEAYEV